MVASAPEAPLPDESQLPCGIARLVPERAQVRQREEAEDLGPRLRLRRPLQGLGGRLQGLAVPLLVRGRRGPVPGEEGVHLRRGRVAHALFDGAGGDGEALACEGHQDLALEGPREGPVRRLQAVADETPPAVAPLQELGGHVIDGTPSRRGAEGLQGRPAVLLLRPSSGIGERLEGVLLEEENESEEDEPHTEDTIPQAQPPRILEEPRIPFGPPRPTRYHVGS